MAPDFIPEADAVGAMSKIQAAQATAFLKKIVSGVDLNGKQFLAKDEQKIKD